MTLKGLSHDSVGFFLDFWATCPHLPAPSILDASDSVPGPLLSVNVVEILAVKVSNYKKRGVAIVGFRRINELHDPKRSANCRLDPSSPGR